MRTIGLALGLLLVLVAAPVAAQPAQVDPALQRSIDALSASLMVGGPGWQAYADQLHDNYSRASTGGNYQRRDAFVEGLRQWWDHGMRVAARETVPVGLDTAGDVAIVRTRVTERFVGPDGAPADGFSGHVTNVWLREDGRWRLLSANIERIAEE